MINLEGSPRDIWKKYLSKNISIGGWMEDSTSISSNICLSKRELFGLIILANIYNHLSSNESWRVCYDSGMPEPNDGYITDGVTKIQVESKIIPQIVKGNPLEEILSTYKKYVKKGDGYGKNRTIIIFPNQTTEGLIKISSLKDYIKDENRCSFDRVLLLHCVAIEDGEVAILQVSEHFPLLKRAQVDFNLVTGVAAVPFCELSK
ncbi:MAG: hypothetical protein ACD_15C00069G0001 [uncultured bacterium]|nr:MAG: hypothetical protein ACD_15C00069G0001 [uncultured bacterium]KKQ43648.1 MAG: hypothetical protein US63_C0048G0007 [Candidatus Moranbacteria bacterium GW2011_GWC2_37_8]KKQ60073.1 MAG: hypothetical protein US82_C0045G0009 [Parcubacteria group bacterium GW2011_GWC1_38_22]